MPIFTFKVIAAFAAVHYQKKVSTLSVPVSLNLYACRCSVILHNVHAVHAWYEVVHFRIAGLLSVPNLHWIIAVGNYLRSLIPFAPPVVFLLEF
jgi:hypothetical protein